MEITEASPCSCCHKPFNQHTDDELRACASAMQGVLAIKEQLLETVKAWNDDCAGILATLYDLKRALCPEKAQLQ